MTEPPPTTAPKSEQEPDWARRRRLAEVFGDVLPDTTDDEREPDEKSADSADRGDAWLKDQVPPHHG